MHTTGQTTPKPSSKSFVSTPSSPRPPFSILKKTLRLSRNSCGVCMQSVKTSQGMAIYTAECSHTFRLPEQLEHKWPGADTAGRKAFPPCKCSSRCASPWDRDNNLYQAVFSDTKEFVLLIDEPSNEIVVWDALTTEEVARWPSTILFHLVGSNIHP